MVDANDKDEAPKSNSSPEADVAQSVIAPSDVISKPDMNSEETEVGFEVTGNMEENEDEDVEECEEEEDEEEEYESEYEDEEVEEKVYDEGLDTDKEREKGKAVVEDVTNKENAVKEDEKNAEVPKSGNELGENLKSGDKRPRPRNRNKKKDEQKAFAANGEKPESSSKKKGEQKVLVANGDKPESSRKKKGSKRVESMGMVFMCTSKTKTDCFRYKVLGLPGNKKDQVAKIYKGMRLFLFDVDLRLMYGIFKAAGPGGYNLEPKAFKADFPSQVRFTVLDDCLPLAEENFKGVLKENYYSRTKFEGLLKADQVKNLCKLFVEMGRGGGSRSKALPKPRRIRPVEKHRIRPVEVRSSRADDLRSSRPREKRKRREPEEERHPRSPPLRERRYINYERPPVFYEREPPVLYEHEALVPRYLPPPRPQPPAMASPVRLYTYERPLDIPPYMHDRVPEHNTYRALDIEPRDREREREPYHMYSREAPSYRDPAYTLPPPEYHLISREYPPPRVPPPEYRLSGGSTRVPSYHDVGHPSDYRSSAAQLPEYRSRTHHRY